MSGRCEYFYRQRVTEAELNLGFELLEKADRSLASDLGVFGIIQGAVPAQHDPVADLTIDLTAPARGYDKLGQRLFFGTGQTINCAVDFAGVATDVPAGGQDKWLGVFLRFKRLSSDPRTDGHSGQVFFRQDESFEIVVRQGVAGPRVPLEDDELLICDVLRRQAQRQILNSDIDTSRRQAFVFAPANAVGVVSGLWKTIAPTQPTVQQALDSADSVLSAHLAATSRRHKAQDVDYTPRGFLTGSNVKGALDNVVDTLSSPSGAGQLGADAVSGAVRQLPAGNVAAQLSLLLQYLNSHLTPAPEAHPATSISARAHDYVVGSTVQAQLETISGYLLSNDASKGASLVGDKMQPGSPYSLDAGNVQGQLAVLLAAVNSHTHDGRYLRCTYRNKSVFKAGVSRCVTMLSDFPEHVGVKYSYVTAAGIPEATTYFTGVMSAIVRCWVSKVGATTSDWELWVHNESKVDLEVTVTVYSEAIG